MSSGFSASIEPQGRLKGLLPRQAVGLLRDLARESQRVVEVGVGTGVLSGALTRAGCRVVGVEASADSIGQFRRSLPTTELIRGSTSELPLRGLAIEVLIVNAFASSTSGPGLTELQRVLAPGGRIVVVLAPSEDQEVGDLFEEWGWPYDLADVEVHMFDGDARYSAVQILMITPK